MRALAPACPERVMAGRGQRFRIAIQGTDPRNGHSFIRQPSRSRHGCSGGENEPWQSPPAALALSSYNPRKERI